MKNRYLLLALLMVIMPGWSLTTAEIVTASLSPYCIEYRVKGVCFWLFCTPYGCKVRTSVRVAHYIPDLVISAYGQTGNNPWQEMRLLGYPISGVAESGGDTNARPGHEKTQIRFKNSDAIGHPAGTIFFHFLAQSGYSCQGGATAFQPYFISTLDFFSWRTGLPESLYPEAITPGLREIGQWGDSWGNLYPRAGAISQTHDYKAAAVIAQRSADIVTRSGQVHVYQPLTISSRTGYWPPSPVREGQNQNHKWQILAPKTETGCAIFPDRDPLNTYADKLATDGGYSWALWRPYSCCKKRGQTFLGSTGG